MQCIEKHQRPKVELPVALPEHFIRSKAPKPDKQAAIDKHQTRGLVVGHVQGVGGAAVGL